MIIDSIKNISYYSNIGERIFKALSYLKENDFSKMKDGKYEIDGENIYALISRHETKPQNKGV
jgi:YhcH/YjgK/YiaL family protein